MLRKVTALALTVFLVLPACGWAARYPFDSIQPLQISGETFCTSFSINELEGYWATAAHCAAYALQTHLIEGLGVTIMGQPAWVVYSGFPYQDIAVFQSDARAPALKLASKAVEQCRQNKKTCEPIYVVGYPWGLTRTVTSGFVGARNIPLTHPSTSYVTTNDLYDLTVAGGNSGSPVFNSKAEVIGVLWGAFQSAPVAIGVPLEAVKSLLAPYWKS